VDGRRRQAADVRARRPHTPPGCRRVRVREARTPRWFPPTAPVVCAVAESGNHPASPWPGITRRPVTSRAIGPVEGQLQLIPGKSRRMVTLTRRRLSLPCGLRAAPPSSGGSRPPSRSLVSLPHRLHDNFSPGHLSFGGNVWASVGKPVRDIPCQGIEARAISSWCHFQTPAKAGSCVPPALARLATIRLRPIESLPQTRSGNGAGRPLQGGHDGTRRRPGSLPRERDDFKLPPGRAMLADKAGSDWVAQHEDDRTTDAPCFAP